MISTECQSCQKKNPTHTCDQCAKLICKNCVQFVAADRFQYDLERTARLSGKAFCQECNHEIVTAAEIEYDGDLLRAKELDIYYRSQSKETRLMKRKQATFKIEECADRDEALLKLAYLAVKSGCKILVDVEVSPAKVRMGSYQTTTWQARGTPIQE